MGLLDFWQRYLVITFALLLKTFINRSSPVGMLIALRIELILNYLRGVLCVAVEWR